MLAMPVSMNEASGSISKMQRLEAAFVAMLVGSPIPQFRHCIEATANQVIFFGGDPFKVLGKDMFWILRPDARFAVIPLALAESIRNEVEYARMQSLCSTLKGDRSDKWLWAMTYTTACLAGVILQRPLSMPELSDKEFLPVAFARHYPEIRPKMVKAAIKMFKPFIHAPDNFHSDTNAIRMTLWNTLVALRTGVYLKEWEEKKVECDKARELARRFYAACRIRPELPATRLNVVR